MAEIDSFNETEYQWSKKADGVNRLARFLLILLYIAFSGLYITLVAVLTKALPLFALFPIFLWMLIFFTWKLVSYDCYVEIRGGRLECGKVIVRKSGKRRRPIVTLALRDGECASPSHLMNGDWRVGLSSVTDLSSTSASDKRITVIYRDGNLRRAVIIESSPSVRRLIASHCPGSAELKK